MDEKICRALVMHNNKVQFSSLKTEGGDIIENDKKYGFLKPKNGVLTFSIINRDGEITEKGVDRAVKLALKAWSLYVPINFIKVKTNGDIRIEFRSENEDKILNQNTLAYMYYPLGSINDGHCVVNTRYWWSNSGKGVDMHKIDPLHYPKPQTKVLGQSWDLDQVLRHEFGHGIFGLQHDPEPKNIMSSNYGLMNEYLSDIDVVRARAKAGTKELPPNILKRWLDWLSKSSDRDY